VTVQSRYCPRCGSALAERPPVACGSCGYQLFVNPRPTASLILLTPDHSRFLALRRAAEPKLGQWEMPGGFCEGWEHPAHAAVREAYEELSVHIVLGQFVGMYIGDRKSVV